MRLAISVGDLNGISAQILLSSHARILGLGVEPIYCVHYEMLEKCAFFLRKKDLLNRECSNALTHIAGHRDEFTSLINASEFDIEPGIFNADSGKYSFESFLQAISLCRQNKARALITLPINKDAWGRANIKYIGHTHALSDIFGIKAMMMLGCEKMFVVLFTEHIALSQVSQHIKIEELKEFFLNLSRALNTEEQIAVGGLNPHCGDNGRMGSEDALIQEALNISNEMLGFCQFAGIFAPDSMFIPSMREKFRYFVSMYHDVALGALKALYFEESINVSLGLPILRTSVDHGVASDIAYKSNSFNTTSFINACAYALRNINARGQK